MQINTELSFALFVVQLVAQDELSVTFWEKTPTLSN